MAKETDFITAFTENQRAALLRQQVRSEELEHERQLAEIRDGSQRSALPAIRPPLHPIIKETIDQLWHRLDKKHWPNITAMRVKKHYPPDIPVPPQAPQHLLGEIRGYANMLFKGEADQYGQFRNHEQYARWLSHLAERVVVHVMTALERLDEGDPNALLLSYHGLSKSDIEKQMREAMSGIASGYAQGVVIPYAASESMETRAQPEHIPSFADKRDSPEQLFRAYRPEHPEVKILDICWAAKQYYRDWKRWKKGEFKNGSTPDLAFRRVLTSGKLPMELRKEPRPKGWQ
jgi:hypothetical protein